MPLMHTARRGQFLALFSGLFLCLVLPGCQGNPSSDHENAASTESNQSPEIAEAEASSTADPTTQIETTPPAKPATETVSPEKTPETKPEPAATTEAAASSTMNKSEAGSSATPAAEMAAASESEATPEDPSDPTASSTPRKIKLLVPEREFTREGKDQAIRISFDDLDLLKVCNMEPVPPDVMDHLPDWLKNLHGQRVILRGWMFPSGRQEGISSFMFVRDNGICCFGRDPKVYDKLGVTMQSGKTTKYIEGRPFDVEATLIIEPDIEGDDEGFWWLYRMEDAKVIDR